MTLLSSRDIAREPMETTLKTRFLMDGMLGRLCRTLRLLGYDTSLLGRGESPSFLLIADRECRRAVTAATRRLDRRGTPPVVLRSSSTADMVAELFLAIGEKPVLEPFTRCIECNLPLVHTDAAEAKRKVPRRVAERFDRFVTCPGCGRVYWEGTHYTAMRGEVEKICKRLCENGLGDLDLTIDGS
jgi:uncharacterized protein with PIN domain